MNPDHHTIRVTFGPMPSAPLLPPEVAPGTPPKPPPRTPMIDIYEGPDGLVLEADLPGVADSDLTVQLEDNVLSLVASVPPTADLEGMTPLHLEYLPIDFARSFILSDEVDRARISAELSQGVLRVFLPRAERARTRRIEVKRS